MKIYRIEKHLGGGPYRSIDSTKWQADTMWWEDRSPGPHSDLPTWADLSRRDRLKCSFGFRTLSQLRRWFTTEERKSLKTHGYRIVRLLAEKIVDESEQQVAFIPAKSPKQPFQYSWDRLIYCVTVAQ